MGGWVDTSHPLTSLQREVHGMVLLVPWFTCPSNTAHAAQLSSAVRCPFRPALGLEGHHHIYNGMAGPTSHHFDHLWGSWHMAQVLQAPTLRTGEEQILCQMLLFWKHLLNTAGSQLSPGVIPSPSVSVSGKWLCVFYIYRTLIVNLFSYDTVSWVSGKSVGILPPVRWWIERGLVSAEQCKCPNVFKVFIKLLKSDTFFSSAH